MAIRFFNVNHPVDNLEEAILEIQRLEDRLSLPPGRKPNNRVEAGKRLSELNSADKILTDAAVACLTTEARESIENMTAGDLNCVLKKVESQIEIPVRGFVGSKDVGLARLDKVLRMRADKAEGSPSASTSALPTITKMAAPAQPTVPFGALVSLSRFIFSSADTEGRLKNHGAMWQGEQQMESVRAAHREALAKFGPSHQTTIDAESAIYSTLEKINSERAGSETEQYKRVAAAFLNEGLTVAGLSYSAIGLAAPTARAQMPEAVRRHSQNAINDFCAVLNGTADPVKLATPSRAMKEAMKYQSSVVPTEGLAAKLAATTDPNERTRLRRAHMKEIEAGFVPQNQPNP